MKKFNRCLVLLSKPVNMFIGFLRNMTAPIRNQISDLKSQKKLILSIACVALLLDNMLYMVIVPIITEYFVSDKDNSHNTTLFGNFSSTPVIVAVKPTSSALANEDALIGVIFASKAIVQLMVNPFTGTFIDRVGYVIPLTLGLMVMFSSTILFAFTKSYGVLFVARSLQGLGSALADTASLGLIADRFQDEKERSKALGIALAFISFGSLVAPPFGGLLCEYVGIEWPFIILASICFADALLLLLVQIPASDEMKAKDGNIPVGTPIYKLFMDPYIAIIAAALMIANFPLAFLEPTIAKWMKDNMGANKFQRGIIWLPAFFPHVAGVYLTVKMTGKYFRYQWLYGALGLVLIGVSTAAVPTCKSYLVLMLPLAFLCFGIALIDTALLPSLAFLVDVRHTSVYGSVYAIADISYSIAYALGPILAGQTVQILGYLKMNIGIGILNMMFAPLLLFLREIYDWKPDKSERTNLLDKDTEPIHLSKKPMNDFKPEEISQNQTSDYQHFLKSHRVFSSDDDEWSTTEEQEGSIKAFQFDKNTELNNGGAKNSTTTSIKPRPRPRTSSRTNKSIGQNRQNAFEKSYETTDFSSPAPWKKNSVNHNAYTSVQAPSSVKMSLSKQELRALANSGVELYNPIYNGPTNSP